MSELNSERLIGLVNNASGMDKLLAVMQALRDPNGGCPWDIEQTYQTILPFTIEEVYEVAESIEDQDFDALRDELGDLLFQVVFYAQIAREEGRFDFYQVVEGICDKLVRRHPHVFAETEFKNEAELKAAWEAQKHKERIGKDESKSSVLDDIPKALPELKRAQKIQKRVAKVGFDWENPDQVWEKVEEEIDETKSAFLSGDQNHLEEEVGDLLFAVVNLSRHYGIDADIALRKANHKFERRFRVVEQNADSPLAEYSLDELEALWQQAKIQSDEPKASD